MNRRRIKSYFKISGAAIFLIIISGYSLYQARNIITGPVIIVDKPANGSSTKEQLVQIVGIAKNINKITLNDRPISINEKGSFNEELLLSNGYNIIKLNGWDKFGKKDEQKIELIYNPENVKGDSSMTESRPGASTEAAAGIENVSPIKIN